MGGFLNINCILSLSLFYYNFYSIIWIVTKRKMYNYLRGSLRPKSDSTLGTKLGIKSRIIDLGGSLSSVHPVVTARQS